MENKRQVQHLVNRSKNIVRLKPRNPEEKSSSPVIVKALCDFKQDQVRFLMITSQSHAYCMFKPLTLHIDGNKFIFIQGVASEEIGVPPCFLKNEPLRSRNFQCI